eukprot:TRINITY_DN10583_c0_g1_i2.p1 TRINITY_DN10583_c0_g1~~TRINITY_DN10583_c0_g1_i2.p1  ORF type:complete len:220 (+),score=75.73 TRINITY_DN10583_c0_g1_i2:200-859(+)
MGMSMSAETLPSFMYNIMNGNPKEAIQTALNDFTKPAVREAFPDAAAKIEHLQTDEFKDNQRAQFDLLDANHDGLIQIGEFKARFREYLLPVLRPHAEANGVQLEMPEEPQGERAWEDFDEILIKVSMVAFGDIQGEGRGLECLFAKIDEDNNGGISHEELLAWATAVNVVFAMLELMRKLDSEPGSEGMNGASPKAVELGMYSLLNSEQIANLEANAT